MDVVRSPEPHPPGLGESHVDVVCAPGLTLTQRKEQRNKLLEEVRLAEGEDQYLPTRDIDGGMTPLTTDQSALDVILLGVN